MITWSVLRFPSFGKCHLVTQDSLYLLQAAFFCRQLLFQDQTPQEVKSLLDNDLDAALREVILSTATAAQAEGFQVQVARSQSVQGCIKVYQDVPASDHSPISGRHWQR